MPDPVLLQPAASLWDHPAIQLALVGVIASALGLVSLMFTLLAKKLTIMVGDIKVVATLAQATNVEVLDASKERSVMHAKMDALTVTTAATLAKSSELPPPTEVIIQQPVSEATPSIVRPIVRQER